MTRRRTGVYPNAREGVVAGSPADPDVEARMFGHEFHPRGAALELMTTKSRQVLLSGPAGTGKSRACMEKINAVCLLKSGVRVLIVRKTLASLTATGLVTWREKVVPEILESGLLTFFGGNKEKPAQYIYHNNRHPDRSHPKDVRHRVPNSSVTVGGMDKPTKIMSGEYDLIYVQEATELEEDDWQALSSRLRNGRLSYHQLMADCNPDAPTHWLHVRCTENKTEMLESVHRDNPVYYDSAGELTVAGRAYIEGVLGDLTGVYRTRLLDGKWAAAEGIIYTSWSRRTHLVNLPEFSPETKLCSGGLPWDWTRYWTIDFGFQHPFVLQRWAVDPDGALWMYGEIYMSHRTVAEHCVTLRSIVTDHKGNWTEPRPRKILADHDAEDRETFHQEFGQGTTPAEKRVKLGLQACMGRLKVKANGRPGVYFVNGATHEIDQHQVSMKRPTCTADEFAAYVWADGEKESPRKVGDDGMDAFRYMVADQDLGGTPRIRSFKTGTYRRMPS